GPRVKQRAPGAQKQEHPTPTLPCTQGRETANRKPAVPCCCCRFWRARCAPALPGPLDGGEAGTTRPRSGRVQGWTRLFARAGDGMDAGVEATQERLPEPARKARHASRTCRAGCPASANRGGLLFGLLFSWPRKRKVTWAPAGARNRSETGESAEAKVPLAPTLSPNDETVEGEGARRFPQAGEGSGAPGDDDCDWSRA